MTHINSSSDLKSRSVYKKRFAFLPVQCYDGKWLWLKNFYRKYGSYTPRSCFLVDDVEFYICSMTVEDAVAYRLAEK